MCLVLRLDCHLVYFVFMFGGVRDCKMEAGVCLLWLVVARPESQCNGFSCT